MNKSDNIEVRYNDTRLRYLRLESDGGGCFFIQTSISHAPDVKEYTYPNMVRMWGIRQTVLTSAISEGAREKWYWGLTKEQAREKLLAWRKKCEAEKLNVAAKTRFNY